MASEKTLREVCENLNITRRVVQGYEKAGLVYATGKNKYGHLLYDEETQNSKVQNRGTVKVEKKFRCTRNIAIKCKTGVR